MLNFCFRILNLSIKGNQLYSFFSFIDGLMTSVFFNWKLSNFAEEIYCKYRGTYFRDLYAIIAKNFSAKISALKVLLEALRSSDCKNLFCDIAVNNEVLIICCYQPSTAGKTDLYKKREP